VDEVARAFWEIVEKREAAVTLRADGCRVPWDAPWRMACCAGRLDAELAASDSLRLPNAKVHELETIRSEAKARRFYRRWRIEETSLSAPRENMATGKFRPTGARGGGQPREPRSARPF